MSQRRKALLLASAIALSVLCWVAWNLYEDSATKHPASRPLVVAISSWPGFAGGLFANGGLRYREQSLFFDHYQLRVEFKVVESAAERDQILGAPEKSGVDVLWSTVDLLASEAPEAARRGVTWKAFMQVDTARAGYGIVMDNVASDVDGLAASRVAVPKLNASGLWLLKLRLDELKVPAERQDHMIQNLERTDTQLDADILFREGRVGAAVIAEPYLTMSSRTRPSNLVYFKSRPVIHILTAPEPVLRRGADIRALVGGWIEGSHRVRLDAALGASVLREEDAYKDLPDLAVRSFLGYSAPALLAENVATLLGDHKKDPEFDRMFIQASGFWKGLKTIETALHPARARDNTIVRQMSPRGQGDSGADDSPPSFADICTQEPARSQDRIVQRVHFETNRSDIEPTETQAIDELASAARTYNTDWVCAEGFTDATGNDNYNMGLSLQRAESARDYLSRHGVEKDRILIQWSGPTAQFGDNTTPEGRASNRTVALTLIETQ